MPGIDADLIKYPFLRRAREVLAELSPDDRDLPRKEIIDQARYRMERAARNAEVDIQNIRGWPQYREFGSRTRNELVHADVVEFYSFFVAVQGSAKDPFLTSCLAKSEAQRCKTFFMKERPEDLPQVFQEATGLALVRESEDNFAIPVETYLAFASDHDLFEVPDWKLTRLPLSRGVIHFETNRIKDLFTAIAGSLMASGMKALRSQPVRADVLMLVRQLEPLIPRKEPSSRANYDYIEKLLKHRPTDGRHRLSWLVLAPYLVNIKGMDETSAIDTIMAYLGESRYAQFVRYQVRRAARQGLLPPSLSTLKSRHSDLYEILNREVLASK